MLKLKTRYLKHQCIKSGKIIFSPLAEIPNGNLELTNFQMAKSLRNGIFEVKKYKETANFL